MSDDPAFNNLIDTLLNSPDGTARAKAAVTLGNHVDELDDDEYDEAKTALNNALTDMDPDVISAAMNALSKFQRKSPPPDDEIYGDNMDDMIEPATQAVCEVCGRPEALIPAGGCDRDDCPYG